MKAITLTQPWATLVAIGAKKIETRSWGTSYRGPLAIHAAKRFPDEAQRYCLTEPFRSILKEHTPYKIIWDRDIKTSDFPLGAVIATCELVHVIQLSSLHTFPACEGIGSKRQFWKLDAQERAFGDYTPGRFAWLLSDIQPLSEPIPAKGSLGLWEWEGG